MNGVYNAIFVKGDLIGESLFYGEGAGPLPTSSAVVGDIVGIAQEISCCGKLISPMPFRKDVETITDIAEVKTRYYIRFSAIDKPGVLAKISGILGKHDISIANVTQKERIAAKIVPIVMMTHEAVERNMASALKEIDGLNVIKKETIRVRMEG